MNLLKFFLFLEKIVGTHRNYHLKSKFVRVLIIIRIVIELLLVSIICLWNIYFSLTEIKNKLMFCLYNTLQIMNDYSIIICSLKCSDTFTKFYVNLNTIKEHFHAHKPNTFTRELAICYLVIMVILMTTPVLYYKQFDESVIGVNGVYFATVCYMYFEGRYYLELYLCIVLISNIVHSMKNFNNAILRRSQKDYWKIIPEFKHHHRTIGNFRSIFYAEDIEQWASFYRRLLICVKQLNICFGSEIFQLLLVIPIYYVFALSYLIEALITQRFNNIFEFIYNVPGLVTCGITMTLLLFSGQQLNSEWKKLGISLAKLTIELMKNPEGPELRAMRDLSRLVGQEPMRVRLAGALPLAMPLLPVALSAFVTYVIVVLQFLKVV